MTQSGIAAVEVGPVRVGAPDVDLVIIAGPCVIESLDLTLHIAEHLAEVGRGLGVPVIFKASFDKANRTSGSSYRGVGLDTGLRVLDSVGRRTGLPTTTDIHLPDQAAAVGEVCSLIQIPAFLARQTDLLVAAAQTGKPVNVKKGQFMAPWDMAHAIDKVRAVPGNGGVMVCERGTFFGYGRLVNDMTGLVHMRSLGVPVVFDATHSVQQPGGLGTATGGNRAMVPPLARAAVAVGVDAVFLETHPDPDRSPSDGANMVPLENVEDLTRQLLDLARLARQWK
ncbi:MAG: 3-deoxy-8-phosphooctulonate synthase [Planctomycetota bacterium]|nr:MAG: 3-deoxy-8-phosphooctulonate synthase [Planctomycetota bacterium]